MMRKVLNTLFFSSCLSLLPALAWAQDIMPERSPNFPAMILGLTFVIIMVALPFYFAFRETNSRQELIKTYLERGEAVPEELLKALETKRPGQVSKSDAQQARLGDLRGGVIFTCIGLGLTAALAITTDNPQNGAWGVVFIFVGVGFFINALLFRRSSNSEQPTSE